MKYYINYWLGRKFILFAAMTSIFNFSWGAGNASYSYKSFHDYLSKENALLYTEAPCYYQIEFIRALGLSNDGVNYFDFDQQLLRQAAKKGWRAVLKSAQEAKDEFLKTGYFKITRTEDKIIIERRFPLDVGYRTLGLYIYISPKTGEVRFIFTNSFELNHNY